MKIRRAEASDSKGIARVHVDSWRTTYTGILPQAYLDGLNYEARENFWKCILANPNSPTQILVLEEEVGIVGFASGGPCREFQWGYEGEVYAIYFLAQHQKKGMGKSLWNHLVEEMYRSRPFSSLMVWVLAQNPYRKFYESLGGISVAKKWVEIGGSFMEELAYGWKDLKNFTDIVSFENPANNIL